MKIYLKKFNFDGEPDNGFLSQLASKTENFTSADLRPLSKRLISEDLAKLRRKRDILLFIRARYLPVAERVR